MFVAGLLAVLTAYNLYHYICRICRLTSAICGMIARLRQILLGCCVGFLALFGLLIFRQTNKPRNVDFLIATDSEMKKVNWTTKGELLGSTRVVVLFLFFIAIFLSVVDLAFYETFPPHQSAWNRCQLSVVSCQLLMAAPRQCDN